VDDIFHPTPKLLKDADDILVDNRGLLAVVVRDAVRQLSSLRVSRPLGGDVCDGSVGWDDGDGGEKAFVWWGASGGVHELERHYDRFCGA
jgi:hypothetical protein